MMKAIKTTLLVLAACAAFHAANAATARYWAGGDTGNWSDDANWRTAAGETGAPQNGDELWFTNTAPLVASNDLEDFTSGAIHFDNFAAAKLDGNAFKLDGNVTIESHKGQSDWPTVATFSNEIACDVELLKNVMVYIYHPYYGKGVKHMILSGVVSGAYGFEQPNFSDSSTVFFKGLNTFTGTFNDGYWSKVDFASVADYGEPCALGAAPSGNFVMGKSMIYSGPSASCNRSFKSDRSYAGNSANLMKCAYYLTVSKSGTTLTLTDGYRAGHPLQNVYLSGPGALAIAAGAEFANFSNVVVNAGATLEIDGRFATSSPAARLTVQGNGKLLGNGGTIENGVVIQAGTATVSSGLSVDGDVSLANGCTFVVAQDDEGAPRTFAVTGSLTLGGTIALQVPEVAAGGEIVLFSAEGSISGAAQFTGLPENATLKLEAKRVVLRMPGSGARTITWSGAKDANWTTAGNWKDANGDETTFADGDLVVFDDTASTTSVTLDAAVAPFVVTVAATTDYVFSGTGKITGVASFVKTGTGALTMKLENDYTGDTTFGDGTALGVVTIDAAAPFGGAGGRVALHGCSTETTVRFKKIAGAGQTLVFDGGNFHVLADTTSCGWLGDVELNRFVKFDSNCYNSRFTLGVLGKTTVTGSSTSFTLRLDHGGSALDVYSRVDMPKLGLFYMGGGGIHRSDLNLYAAGNVFADVSVDQGNVNVYAEGGLVAPTRWNGKPTHFVSEDMTQYGCRTTRLDLHGHDATLQKIYSAFSSSTELIGSNVVCSTEGPATLTLADDDEKDPLTTFTNQFDRFTGSLSLVKGGAGTWLLGGTSDQVGSWSVTNGTVQTVLRAGALGAATNVCVVAPGKLVVGVAGTLPKKAVLETAANDAGTLGTVEIGAGIVETVKRFRVDGKWMKRGVYGSAAAKAANPALDVVEHPLFAGDGVVRVLLSAPPGATLFVR